ncbi:MAG TPA: hypothetical protein PKE41_09725 [Candidatus Macondimonas sp.]|nr:hypothetical protein [Candidatus Macondimonas sp.]
MRAAIRIIGILALLLGIWWILQGTGLAPVGFMANQMPWAYRGMGLLVTGAVLLLFARQNRSR